MIRVFGHIPRKGGDTCEASASRKYAFSLIGANKCHHVSPGGGDTCFRVFSGT